MLCATEAPICSVPRAEISKRCADISGSSTAIFDDEPRPRCRVTRHGMLWCAARGRPRGLTGRVRRHRTRGWIPEFQTNQWAQRLPTWAATGGVVYAGCRIPELVGTYFYGDFCTGLVRSFRLVNGVATEPRDWTSGLAGIDRISSFGTDAEGEVYVVDYDGEVYRLEPQA